jgi:hypothetical protein
MVFEHKMSVSIFSTTFVWNISQSKRNDQKSILVFMYITRYSRQSLIKLEFLDRF